MSSHHIVKDEQEPALILWNAEDWNKELFSQLLEWSPVVVATQNTYRKLLDEAIKIDLIFCNNEQHKQIEKETTHQYPIKVISTKEHQLTEAISYLKNHNHKAINIYAKCKGELIEKLKSFSGNTDLVIYNQSEKGVFTKTNSFEKWVAANTEFILPFNILKTENLCKTAPNLWKVQEDGYIRISASDTFFLIEKI